MQKRLLFRAFVTVLLASTAFCNGSCNKKHHKTDIKDEKRVY